MSSASHEVLYRSSIFKALLVVCTLIAAMYGLIVRLVYLGSDAFYRTQLERELVTETELFSRQAELRGSDAVYPLIQNRQQQGSPFSYTIEAKQYLKPVAGSYPAVLAGLTDKQGMIVENRKASVALGENQQLLIGISSQLQDKYRAEMMPVMISGVLLPAALMLAIVAVIALTIIRRLQDVNQAMNRVLCGEKQVKLPVSHQNDEFDLIAIHLNFLIEQVEKQEASLRSLTVGLAHDLRTPIARIRLRLDDLLSQHPDSRLSERQQTSIEACHDDVELLLGLFNGMLEIASLNSGKELLNKQEVNLSLICADVVDFIQPIAQQKSLSVVIREDGHCTVQGEPSLLFRAIYNLVENAVKYSPVGGQIDVVIDPFGLVVCDQGCGIPSEEKKRVCEPLYRCDNSRSTQGEGLGLALVNAVVKRHSGTLVLGDNHPGLRARMMF
ncbi:sensor histidine kinase [Photobacterium satsumensis]|uniref:sensor histidine kinase n=1 Tax=Photobacterium satsumensis TaxID=2910239 RepID=UPI003D0C8620